MKALQAQLKEDEDIGTKLEPLKAIKPQLVMLFGSRASFAPDGLAARAAREFEGAITIGCSTAGEISNKGVSDATLVVTAGQFDKAKFKQAAARISSMDNSKNAGQMLAEKIDKNGLKAVFVLCPGLEINGSAVIEGIRSVLGTEVVITGGLAGDGAKFETTYTLISGEVAKDQIVAFGVYGDVTIGYGYMGGWEPFGPARKVTKSVQNILFELDGQPALDLYKKYLGEEAKNLPASGLLYPLALLKDNKDTSGIIRTILGVNEASKSITLAGDIPEGGLVSLMHTNKGGLVKGAEGAAEHTKRLAPGSGGFGILISCVGRKLVMGDDVEDEFDAVRDAFGEGVVTGFYSYGEICQDGFSECRLHNQTMTITFIQE